MMTGIWIPITIVAAVFQALRTGLQKQLALSLSTNASAFTRFLYGLPFALLYLMAVLLIGGHGLPPVDATFLLWVLVGSIGQSVATALLVAAIGMRSFAVGVAYSKTEVIQAAIVGLVLLGEPPTPGATIGIVIATLGVMVMSMARSKMGFRALVTALRERSVLVGLGAGTGFAVAAVGFRGAALELGLSNVVLAAAYTLAWATVVQTVTMGAFLAWREPAQLVASFRSWRTAGLVGLTSILGSACWFTAMTVQLVAYVRTLGLVELIFTYALTRLWFKERVHKGELWGMVAVVLGIGFVLLRG